MDVDKLLSGESQTVEYKAQRLPRSKSYARTVVAFANARGGTLVFGVDDKTRELVGIPDEQVFQEMDAITNAIMDSVEPQIIPEVTLRSVHGKSLILVEVPVGRQCPYFLKSEGLEKGVYVRVGASTRHADLEWIRELTQECAPGGFDRLVRRGFSVSGDDIARLCDRMYEVALSRSTGPEVANIRRVTKSQLLSWGVLVNHEGETLPTNAFLILTGNDEAVRPLQCAIFKDDSRAVFLDRRDITGDIMTQIEGSYHYVLEKMNMGADLGGVVRRDVYELPTWSVREVITNAVLHRSYVERSSVQVALHSDRLEVSSPGGIMRGFSLDRAMSGESRPRNEALAQAFLYMRLIEGWGSGIPRVSREFEERGMRAPKFQDNDGRFRVSLWRPSPDGFASYLRDGMSRADNRGVRLGSFDGRPMEAGGQTMPVDRQATRVDRKLMEVDRSALVLSYLQGHGPVRAADVSEFLGLSRSHTRTILRGMAQQGFIQKLGDKRYARYVPAL